MPRVKHHWVRLEDEDLAFILDGPDPEVSGDYYEVWVDRVLNIIEDGLETA